MHNKPPNSDQSNSDTYCSPNANGCFQPRESHVNIEIKPSGGTHHKCDYGYIYQLLDT
ncbi:MAG: hypothetical protein IJ776_00825 [Paludibacteraceae bacterium]|nr:hypothetical protein [Paludibacteraceae bacterium]